MCNSLGIWKCPYFLMAEGDHVFQTRLWTKVLFSFCKTALFLSSYNLHYYYEELPGEKSYLL